MEAGTYPLGLGLLAFELTLARIFLINLIVRLVKVRIHNVDRLWSRGQLCRGHVFRRADVPAASRNSTSSLSSGNRSSGCSPAAMSSASLSPAFPRRDRPAAKPRFDMAQRQCLLVLAAVFNVARLGGVGVGMGGTPHTFNHADAQAAALGNEECGLAISKHSPAAFHSWAGRY